MSDTSEKREETAPPAAPDAPAPQPPATDTAPAPQTGTSVSAEGPAPPQAAPDGATQAPQFRRRRRRRRRRRGPRPDGVNPAEAGAGPALAAAASTDPAAEPPPGNPAAPAPTSEAQPSDAAAAVPAPSSEGAPPAGDQQRRRRRRRRRRKPPPGAETGAPSEGGATVADAAAPGQPASETDARPPRKPWRGRSRGRDREGQGENREQRSRENREQRSREDRPRGDGPRGGDGKRDRRDKRHGGPRKPGFGRGRDRDEGRGKKPEQKLYAAESIVDHGFEDVPPAEEGGEPRRVDWTIVKRMMVDQRSTRSISTVYVLKRDGAETEFPFLAAAREAVNKKIVHPEKLTQPKESYAALYTKK